MSYWLTSMNKKRHQRAMNRLVREANKSLEQDYLWCGRFVIKQIDSPHFVPYSDGSGAEYYVTIRLIDRCTGRYYTKFDTVNHWRGLNGNGWRLFEFINWFIVEHCKVWDEPLPGDKNYEAWREYNKNTRKV